MGCGSCHVSLVSVARTVARDISTPTWMVSLKWPQQFFGTHLYYSRMDRGNVCCPQTSYCKLTMSQIWTLTHNHFAAVVTAVPSPKTFLVVDPKVRCTVAWPEFNLTDFLPSFLVYRN